MRLYLIDQDDTEITDVIFHAVRKQVGGGGALSFNLRDRALANAAKIKEYLWQRVEVRKNDGTTVLWEGLINSQNFKYNSVDMTGIEALTVLQKVDAAYDGIIARGVVTNAADDYVDDSQANFGTEVNGKPCNFSDVDVPEIEYAWAHSDTDFNNDHLGGDDPADTETFNPGGNHLDTRPSTRTNDYMMIADTNLVANGYGIDVVFQFTGHASATKIEANLELWVISKAFCEGNFRPAVKVYNTITTNYDSVGAHLDGLGYIDTSFSEIATAVAEQINITITDNFSDYFDVNGKIIFRVYSGDPAGEAPVDLPFAIVACSYARGKITIQSIFDAENIVYTIDAYTSTRLTFTGQTPNADGVANGDLYLVGDFLHNVLDNIWDYAGIRFCTIDFDNSTLNDPSDYRSSFVGGILQTYAEWTNRRLFQKIGWVITCKTSLTATGLSLTESAVETDDEQEGWNFRRDGNTMAKIAFIFGGGINVIKMIAAQYPCPFGKIISDPRIMTLSQAVQFADNIETRAQTPFDLIPFTIDMDSADYSAVDVGKTLTLTMYSTIVFTNALIYSVSYQQNAGEHLFCKLEIQDI